eukprot:COSAG01_NODE_6540_length_3615_cov_7.991115_2_plen_930_part_00
MESESFIQRHIGSSKKDQKEMLQNMGYEDINTLINDCIDPKLQCQELNINKALSEAELLAHLQELANKNENFKNFIGQGYYPTHMPAVIQRNVFENPNWYTAYTPYQAEISQGRLYCLFQFQTLIAKLTGMDFANASLLDEGTAVAEAMLMAKRLDKQKRNHLAVIGPCFEQTLSVLNTRAKPLGLQINQYKSLEEIDTKPFAILSQYPNAQGNIDDLSAIQSYCQENDIRFIVATDLLALMQIKTPGAYGADIVVGSSQRFGVPMGYGGPHAAFFATKDCYKRQVPGRIVGLSKDVLGNKAYRLTLVTREQHIRRDKATSNICTAQALLANIALFYAVWHGQKGLQNIATRVHHLTNSLSENLNKYQNITSPTKKFFDTLTYICKEKNVFLSIQNEAIKEKVNFYYEESNLEIRISVGEGCTRKDIEIINNVFAKGLQVPPVPITNKTIKKESPNTSTTLPSLFEKEKSESWMLRWLKKLVNKDYNLTDGMIPLGSCTMKCNASAYMQALSWPSFNACHPFAPKEQVKGYHELFKDLEEDLKAITGMHAISLQPNAGASGEYAGLLAIKAYLESKQENNRDLILIPDSAHGTNPASAKLAGFRVLTIKQLENGYLDEQDLEQKIEKHKKELAGMMITYPSTFGVFEENIKDICNKIHQAGGQVYLDGANMNAQVGLVNPAKLGFDVMHLNLHKTFSIPHGGGGPGVGPIAVKSHLSPFLPDTKSKNARLISAAPYGSALILLISYAYIRLMGKKGLLECSQLALLHANYLAKNLEEMGYELPFKNKRNKNAHECIVDFRKIKRQHNLLEMDIAKRLMDYGFHAPTMSWPVVATMMIEPTESEDKAELDRFLAAMQAISIEINDYIQSKNKDKHVLKHAPFILSEALTDTWQYSFSKKEAFPIKKAYASVKRLNDSYGDINFCACSKND